MSARDRKTPYRTVLVMIMTLVMVAAMAVAFAGCSSEEATEATEATEALIPTRGVEYDENGELTPESKEMLVEQQRDEDAQRAWEEYQDSLAQEEMNKWDEGDPGHQGLPGGH